MISSAEYLTEDEWDDLDAVSPPSPATAVAGGGGGGGEGGPEEVPRRRWVRSINQIPIIRGKLTFRVRRAIHRRRLMIGIARARATRPDNSLTRLRSDIQYDIEARGAFTLKSDPGSKVARCVSLASDKRNLFCIGVGSSGARSRRFSS